MRAPTFAEKSLALPPLRQAVAGTTPEQRGNPFLSY